MPQAVAVYTRISSDPEGDRLGVTRQTEDCQALAARKGWPVAEVYVDDDRSAYSGKPRPAYLRMLDDITAKDRDGVVVYNLDRLHRQPRELEAFLDICDAAGLTALASVEGDINLGSSEGRFHARIVGAVSRKSSDDASRRIKRKNDERAAAGLPTGGGTRPFGWRADRVTLDPAEAGLVQEAATRVLAGESVRAVATDWNARGIATAAGKRWTVETLRRMLYNPRLSAQREHRGEIVAPGQWAAILTVEQTATLRAVLDERTRSRRRPVRRYLLTGLLRCGLCGAALIARPQADGQRRYVCAKGPGHAGCGRTAITAAPVEVFIAAAILERLNSPALAAALAGAQSADAATAAEQRALREDEDQLDELARQWARKEIGSSAWRAARDIIEAQIAATRRKIERLSRSSAIDAFVGHAADLGAVWEPMPLDRQRSIVGAVLDRAIVRPAVRGRSTFDADRVEPIWRDA